MPDNATHVFVGVAVLSVARFYEVLPSENFEYVAASFLFMIGCGLADITALFYAVPLRNHARIRVWNPDTWDDGIYAELDKKSVWSIPYKVAHSFPFSITILYAAFYYCESILVLWFGAGHLLHIAMDAPTHKRSWFWYPFGFVLLEEGENWYESEFFTKIRWKKDQSIPAALVAIEHAVEAGWYLLL